MPSLFYGTFEAALHPYITPKISKLTLANILLLSPLIGFPMSDKEFQESPDSVDDTTASRIRNGKRVPPSKILEHYSEPDALKHIKDCFAANIVPRVQESAKKTLLQDVLTVVQADRELPPETKKYFERLAERETLGNFLAEVYLCAISQKPPIERASNLPAQNCFFLGRESQLKIIEERFQDGASVQGLSGMGGVGKTQLALQYAHAHLMDYETVWWISAETQPDLQNSIVHLLTARKTLPENTDAEHICQAFQDYCKAHSRWLLIYDNAEYEDSEQYDILKAYFPQDISKGNVLLTTRCKNAFETAVQYEVPVFGTEEASLFLRLRSRCDGSGAARLAEQLGFLPLALEYAAAYIRETPGVDFAAYSKKLEQYSIKLLDRRVGHLSYKWTVREAFHITLDKIFEGPAANSIAKSAKQFLTICAYLASDNIDINVFISHENTLPNPLDGILRNELDRDELIRTLTKYSLMQCGNGKLCIHQLLQEVLRDEVGIENEITWVTYGIETYFDLAKNIRMRTDPQCLSLAPSAPHMLVLLQRYVQNYQSRKKTLRFEQVLYISREYFLWSSYALAGKNTAGLYTEEWIKNQINSMPTLKTIAGFYRKMPSEKNFYLAAILHHMGSLYIYSGDKYTAKIQFYETVKILQTVTDSWPNTGLFPYEATEYVIHICTFIGKFSIFINDINLLCSCHACLLKGLRFKLQSQQTYTGVSLNTITQATRALKALSNYIAAVIDRAVVIQIQLPPWSCPIKESAPHTNTNFMLCIPSENYGCPDKKKSASTKIDLSRFDILLENCTSKHSARLLNESWTTMAFPENVHTGEEMLSFLESINVKMLTITAKRSLCGVAYVLAETLNDSMHMNKFKNKLEHLAN